MASSSIKQPEVLKLVEWLKVYCSRTTIEQGIKCRKQLGDCCIMRNDLITLYVISEGDPDVRLQIDDRVNSLHISHEEFHAITNTPANYCLIVKYKNVIAKIFGKKELRPRKPSIF